MNTVFLMVGYLDSEPVNAYEYVSWYVYSQ